LLACVINQTNLRCADSIIDAWVSGDFYSFVRYS